MKLVLFDTRKQLLAIYAFNRKDTCTKQSARESSNIYETFIDSKIISSFENQTYLGTHSDEVSSQKRKHYSLSHDDEDSCPVYENLTNDKFPAEMVSNNSIVYLTKHAIGLLLIIIRIQTELLSSCH